MDDTTTERRLREADPLARRTTEEARDQEWLRETARSVSTQTPSSRHPWGRVLVAAAAAAVLAATAGGVLLRGGDENAKAPDVAAPPTVTDLTMPADSMGMCIAFSVEELSKSPVALGGEVVDISGDEVLVEVERWYRGGDSDQVRLSNPDPNLISLGYAIDFEVGKRYLLAAYDGTVSTCGFSGPWNTTLGDAYEQAFAG